MKGWLDYDEFFQRVRAYYEQKQAVDLSITAAVFVLHEYLLDNEELAKWTKPKTGEVEKIWDYARELGPLVEKTDYFAYPIFESLPALRAMAKLARKDSTLFGLARFKSEDNIIDIEAEWNKGGYVVIIGFLKKQREMMKILPDLLGLTFRKEA